jgi:hypothetical protein
MVAAQNELVRDALWAQLGIVEARLDSPLAGVFRAPSDGDPEEVLRVLMVRLWPRLSRGVATPADRAQFFAMLAHLWEPALSEDLRFLDAWNNAYEVAADEFPPSLLAAYAQLLDAHVRRLSP